MEAGDSRSKRITLTELEVRGLKLDSDRDNREQRVRNTLEKKKKKTPGSIWEMIEWGTEKKVAKKGFYPFVLRF